MSDEYPVSFFRTVRIRRAGCSGEISDLPDEVAVEEPLEIRIAFGPAHARQTKSISITMRTPGHDRDLAAGFLVSESVVTSADDILTITPVGLPWLPGETANAVQVELASTARIDIDRLARHFYTTSSCGVCGKSSIESLKAVCEPSQTHDFHISVKTLCSLPAKLRAAQTVFERTGGLHGAALFDDRGDLLAIREDVGRHNAVDKLIGAEFLQGRVPLGRTGLLLSGRASFELIQKAATAGITLVAAIGAPSSLAVALAAEFRITLVGFVRADRLNIYTDESNRVRHHQCE